MTAKALIIAGYGLNCEEETAFAFMQNGFEAHIRHINDLAETPEELNDIQVLCIPGGFSYGDDTGSGNAFAQKMRLTLWDHLKTFISRDTLTLGICNGCQILTNLGLIPGLKQNYGERLVAVTHNENARYQCRWVDIKAETENQSPWLQNIRDMHIPVAHGEGRFLMDKNVLQKIQNQIAFRYVTPDGKGANGKFPHNPNGSVDDIAAMTDESGKILAIMPHPERGMFTWQRDDYHQLKDQAQRENTPLQDRADGMTLFENAARYFETARQKIAV